MARTTDRDEFSDQFRVVPLTCTDAKRRRAAALGKLLPMELHTTSDQFRAFVQNRIIAPVWHGEASGESEMLALHETSDRGVFRGDKVYRTDTDTIWECISGNGTTPDDWIEYRRTSGTAGLQLLPMCNGSSTNPAYLFTSAGEPILVWVDPSTLS